MPTMEFSKWFPKYYSVIRMTNFSVCTHTATLPSFILRLSIDPLYSVLRMVYFGSYSITAAIFLRRPYSAYRQLTHNMTRDCSLNSPQKYEFRTCCVQKLFLFCFCFGIQNDICTQNVLNLYFSRNSMNNILWVTWCKNKANWKKFTCSLREY